MSLEFCNHPLLIASGWLMQSKCSLCQNHQCIHCVVFKIQAIEIFQWFRALENQARVCWEPLDFAPPPPPASACSPYLHCIRGEKLLMMWYRIVCKILSMKSFIIQTISVIFIYFAKISVKSMSHMDFLCNLSASETEFSVNELGISHEKWCKYGDEF